MCEDIDECAETLNCTAPNTVCVNKPGSFACNCQASHMGDPLSAEGCSNICNSNPCFNDGTCTAVENGFTCLCPSGYVGLTCTEEDPELKKLKWIAIVVGGIAGFLLVVLAITLLVVCCKRKKLDVPTPREEDVNELLWSSGYQPGLLRATLHDRDFEKLELEQQNANRRDPVIGERPGDVELRYQPIHYPTGIYSIDSTNNSTLDYTLENGAGPSRLGTEYF
ncbi:uncharacterized protein [Ptychodera flava]|uniref:uncharacterized protein isoform X2 n=1 Tax=Ptychodera flava TaxID=63121 RepID=UPI00396A8FF1